MIPVPIRFVSTNTSPTWAPLFFQIQWGFTCPVTDIPKMGSLFSMLWPPTIAAPDSATIEPAPFNTSVNIPCSTRGTGKPTMFIAVNGVPPIAYTSLNALAAAILPNKTGSFTIGVKKSKVCTNANVSEILYTPASSEPVISAKTWSFVTGVTAFKTRFNICGPILHAQPPFVT